MTSFKELWQSSKSLFPMAFAGSILMCGYELLRSSTSSLFNREYGSNYLPVVTGLTPVLILLLLWIYSQLLSKVGPKKTLLITTLGSGSIFFIGFFAYQHKLPWVVALLWMFREAYIMLLVEQYWSFINSVTQQERAKQINGIILGISSLGAIVGSLLTSMLAKKMGTPLLLILGGFSTLPAAWLSMRAYQKLGEPKPSLNENKITTLGLQLVKSSPLLKRMFVMVILVQVVSATLGFAFEGFLQKSVPLMDEQTAYRGQILTLTNSLSLMLQFLVAPFLLSRFRLVWILALIPLVNFIGSFCWMVFPSMATASFAFIIFKSLDYSLFRAGKEVLYIPLGFDVRYRAKEIVDVFGNRFGKAMVSSCFAGLQFWGVMVSGLFIPVSIAASLLWFFTALGLSRLGPDDAF